MDNPPISAVEFQPFNHPMSFELEDAHGMSFMVGDEVRMYFDQSISDDQIGATKTSRSNDVITHIASLTRSESPALLNLKLKLADDDQAYRLLQERVAAEQTRGKLAFPQHVRLKIFPRYGRRADQLLRVPASAITRAGAEAYVWVIVDEFAIPVRVHEVKREEQSSVVVEKAGARGLPIHPEHWRSMGAYARSRAFLAAHKLDDARLPSLLGTDVWIIEQSNNKLQAGSKVRSLGVGRT